MLWALGSVPVIGHDRGVTGQTRHCVGREMQYMGLIVLQQLSYTSPPRYS